MCNSLRAGDQIPIEGTVHICFGPFTVRIFDVLTQAHIYCNILTVLDLSLVVVLKTFNPKADNDVCLSSASTNPVCVYPVSDDGSASSSKPPRSNISRRHIILFGRLQQDPVSSTLIATLPSVDIARLTDCSTATSETRLHRLRRSQISGTQRQGRYPYLSVRRIRDSRSV